MFSYGVFIFMYTSKRFVIAYGKAHTYLFYICCEELRRYFNNIIDKSLFFLVIRSLANKMAKKWRSQSRFGEMESLFGEIESRFGEENGEVNRALAKWNRSLAKWNRSLAKKWRRKWRSNRSLAKWNRSLAKNRRRNGEENGEENGEILRFEYMITFGLLSSFFIRIYIKF